MSCPLCTASGSYVETLSRGYQFCGRCGYAFLLDAAGEVVDVVPTNHTKDGRRAPVPVLVTVDLSKCQSNPRREVVRERA